MLTPLVLCWCVSLDFCAEATGLEYTAHSLQVHREWCYSVTRASNLCVIITVQY